MEWLSANVEETITKNAVSAVQNQNMQSGSAHKEMTMPDMYVGILVALFVFAGGIGIGGLSMFVYMEAKSIRDRRDDA
jgi:hypothetical protein